MAAPADRSSFNRTAFNNFLKTPVPKAIELGESAVHRLANEVLKAPPEELTMDDLTKFKTKLQSVNHGISAKVLTDDLNKIKRLIASRGGPAAPTATKTSSTVRGAPSTVAPARPVDKRAALARIERDLKTAVQNLDSGHPDLTAVKALLRELAPVEPELARRLQQQMAMLQPGYQFKFSPQEERVVQLISDRARESRTVRISGVTADAYQKLTSNAEIATNLITYVKESIKDLGRGTSLEDFSRQVGFDLEVGGLVRLAELHTRCSKLASELSLPPGSQIYTNFAIIIEFADKHPELIDICNTEVLRKLPKEGRDPESVIRRLNKLLTRG
jgi:hypothetical protein